MMGRPRVATPFAAWRRWTVFPLDTRGTGRRMRARVAAIDAFARRAGVCAYLVAALSIGYAVVYLGFASRNADDHPSNALAYALIAAGALAASVATVGMSDRAGGPNARWLAPFGVGYALLSAAHGVYAAILAGQGLAAGDLSATDPRGLATFGLAGVWMLALGLSARGAATIPRNLALLAITGGADLILLFFATVAGSTPLILLTGGFASVVLGPAFWIWSGRLLGR